MFCQNNLHCPSFQLFFLWFVSLFLGKKTWYILRSLVVKSFVNNKKYSYLNCRSLKAFYFIHFHFFESFSSLVWRQKLIWVCSLCCQEHFDYILKSDLVSFCQLCRLMSFQIPIFNQLTFSQARVIWVLSET